MINFQLTVRDVSTGEESSHMVAPDYGNYATACGISNDDDLFETVHEKSGMTTRSKINCPHCTALFELCRDYRVSHFAKRI